MNAMIFSLIISLLLAGCDHNAFVKPKTFEASDIVIKSVYVEPMSSRIEPPERSIIIDFINNGQTIKWWQFGCYIPCASLCKLVSGYQNINPNLLMEICDSENNCAPLHYDKAVKITENDLSQGYTNLLSPTTAFPLLSNKSYRIKLLHNNFWGGGNISYFPQNMFFLLSDGRDNNNETKQVFKLDTTFETYDLAKYDQRDVDDAIDKHIQANWNNSIPFDRNKESSDIIPSPVKVITTKGRHYTIENNLVIHNQLNQNNQVAFMIAESLKSDFNISTSVDNMTNVNSGIIVRSLLDTSKIQNNPEGYVLIINTNNIIIQAINNAGVYYAYQTLRQLWKNAANFNNDKGFTLPQVFIVDYPRFKYRGLMLDVARHYFSIAELKSLIDLMGIHKLNTLHLHLSDDEAFRLALPDYPTLSSIGARRGLGLLTGPMMFLQGNLYKNFGDSTNVHADTIYNGSYSPSDINNIITYANENQITVIPEIDLPAHARALIKSLPDQMIDPNDHSRFISAQGYTDDVLPVCTYNSKISIGPNFTKVINDIINKIGNLFNGQTTVYAIKNEISIGGDEVSANAWTVDSSCCGAWKKLSALQKSHKFFNLLAQNNPSIIFSGWQQFVQTDCIALGKGVVAANRTGHVWVWSNSALGIMQAIRLVNHKYPTVLALSDKTYFDLAYTPNIREPGLNWASKYGDTQAALSSTLCATKVMEGAHPLARVNLLGLEAALWSETIASHSQMLYMILPKMAGLAEASWSPSATTHNGTRINWQSLASRLGCGHKGFLAYLTQLKEAGYRGYPDGINLEVPKGICN